MHLKRTLITTSIAAGTFFVGVAIGVTPQDDPETVTVTETVTETETVEVVPKACKQLVDRSEAYADTSTVILGYAHDGMTAVSEFDVAGIEASTRNLEDLQPEVERVALEFWESHTACGQAANR